MIIDNNDTCPGQIVVSKEPANIVSYTYESYIPISEIHIDIVPPLPASQDRMASFIPLSNLNSNDHPMITRSKYEIYKNKVFFAANVVIKMTADKEPYSFKQALQVPEWKQAMKEIYDALIQQGTWFLVPPQQHKNLASKL